jgi:hypothetical protein|tara:strand:+ start:120 stop:254 length:135 start_codon:yes stop_codon:yes gene_type:complete
MIPQPVNPLRTGPQSGRVAAWVLTLPAMESERRKRALTMGARSA